MKTSLITNKKWNWDYCLLWKLHERKLCDEGDNHMTTNINVTLSKHIQFVLEKMDEIEECEELSIHQMADLERFAKTLSHLAQTYKTLNE